MKCENWKTGAEQLARTIRRERLHPAVLRTVADGDSAASWLLACSGGADSVCMVLALYGHFSERREIMRVVHFNHGVRGKDSDADEVFAAELATGLGIGHSVGRWHRGRGEPITESTLRKARLSFFHSLDAKSGNSMIFFGHQKDDIVETMLMRISRGSSLSGLSAPRPVQRFRDGRLHLRPLLNLSHREIVESLMQVRVPWREDDSNRGDQFYRNRIRQRVIPAWRGASPHIVGEGAARVRRLLEEDDAALEKWLDARLPVCEPGNPMDLGSIRDMPEALHRRAIHRFLKANAMVGVLSAKAVDRLLSLFAQGRSTQTSAGDKGFIVLSGDQLALRMPETTLEWNSIAVVPPDQVSLPNGASLNMEWVALSDRRRLEILAGRFDHRREAFLRIDRESGLHLVVRRWAPGDRYLPLGASGRQKIQDLFTNRKIPRMERSQLPIVCLPEGEIAWCPMLPPAEVLRIEPKTDRALRLTYVPSSTR